MIGFIFVGFAEGAKKSREFIPSFGGSGFKGYGSGSGGGFGRSSGAAASSTSNDRLSISGSKVESTETDEEALSRLLKRTVILEFFKRLNGIFHYVS